MAMQKHLLNDLANILQKRKSSLQILKTDFLKTTEAEVLNNLKNHFKTIVAIAEKRLYWNQNCNKHSVCFVNLKT